MPRPLMEQKVMLRIPVGSVVQPASSMPRAELLHCLHKAEMVVFVRSESCCLQPQILLLDSITVLSSSSDSLSCAVPHSAFRAVHNCLCHLVPATS